MKHIVKGSAAALVCVLLLTSAMPRALAQEDAAKVIEAKIQKFYQNLATGNMDAAFAEIMVGGRGFLANGMLAEIPDEATHAQVIQVYKSNHSQGARINLQPKHIQVSPGEQGAVATFYVEGQFTGVNGDVENVLARTSHVWVKVADDWKLFHWHISRVEMPD